MLNRPHGFDIYLNVKIMRTIEQIFVAFSEKLNCNPTDYILVLLLHTSIAKVCSVENYNRCPHKVNQVHFDIDSL